MIVAPTDILSLGQESSRAFNEYTDSTKRSMMSHLKLLREYNNIPITRDALLSNPTNLLTSLVDRKGEKLKFNYQRQIAMTIKRLFPNDNVDLRKFINRPVAGSAAEDDNGATSGSGRFNNDVFISEAKTIVNHAVEQLKEMEKNWPIELDVGLLDTYIAILLTVSTSMRINELRQLRVDPHFQQMRNNMDIAVATKGRGTTLRHISLNSLLLSTISYVERTRGRVERSINEKILQHLTAKKVGDSQRARLSKKFVLVSSEDFMRKKLHNIAALLNMTIVNSRAFGFNVFRKLITSLLVDHNQLNMARNMNNHSNLDTTLQHYNIVSGNAVNRAYDRLLATAPTSATVDKLKQIIKDAKVPAVAIEAKGEAPPFLTPPQSVRIPPEDSSSTTFT